MKNCDCEEPCEDCEHEEKVDLDNISNVLFGGITNAKESSEEEVPAEEVEEPVEESSEEVSEEDSEGENIEEEVEEKSEESDKENIEKEVKEEVKKKPSKVECEDKEYKDPITEDYKKEFNNKIGRKIRGKRYAEDFY